MGDPFALFPLEVWEMILDELTDSKDAWTMFRTFPELDMNASLQKKKRIWLFGLVIPHLIPSIKVNWIDEADLLHCRLVSRGWSLFVDNFLETQNQLRAYHCFRPQPQIPGGFYWDTQQHYLERIEVGVGAGRLFFRENQVIGGTYICDSHSDNLTITRFLQEFEGHPQGRNPFLARFLSINVYPDGGGIFEELWNNNATFQLLDLFGKHIWHYQMHFGGNDLEPQYMATCLGLLPNLRTLHLKGMLRRPEELLSEEELAPFLMPGEGSLPHLPYLETLRIEKYHLYKSGAFLIRRYSGQIRRLDVEISLWKPEYSLMFSNLAELELTFVEPCQINDLNDLLLAIQAPLLSKLMLKSEFFGPGEEEFCSRTISIEVDIFPWLRRFPNIQYLDLGDEFWIARCAEEGTLSPERDSIRSLKFLSIRTSPKMSYNFLRCLPSLQYLHLHVHPEPLVIDLSGHLPSHVRILDAIQTGKMYRSNIWALLPNLRTVTLLPESYFDGTYYTFSREGYEKGMSPRNGASTSSVCDCDHPSPLRPDIIQFLRERKKWDRESDWELYYGWDGDTCSDSDDSSNY